MDFIIAPINTVFIIILILLSYAICIECALQITWDKISLVNCMLHLIKKKCACLLVAGGTSLLKAQPENKLLPWMTG